MYPEIVLSDSLSIPTYFVFNSLLFCFLLVLVKMRADRFALPIKTALDLSAVLMVSGFLGARVFHIVFEAPEHYVAEPVRVLYFWEGGFVFYGGAIVAFFAGLLFVRRQKLDWKIWADFFAPVAALGYGLGRVGCFLAGCCYGRFCHLPWAYHERHPTQLYAALWEICVFALLVFLIRKKQWGRGQKPGQLFFVWLTLHAIGRSLMELFRADERGPMPLELSISTWISFILLVTAARFLSQKPA